MKTLFTLENTLYFAGGLHFAILAASALVPVVLDWKTVLRPLPPFVRTLFWVYGAFIVLMIVGLGTLTLLHAPAMARGEPVARAVTGFIAIFWGARLLVQLLVFDATPYLTTVWLKLGDHLLTAAFVLLAVIYTFTALQPGSLIRISSSRPLPAPSPTLCLTAILP